MSDIKYSKTIESQKDTKLFPIIKISYLEKQGDVAVVEPYGIHGSPPVETICLMLTINNDEANRLIIPMSALTRTKNLEEGEFECGNFVIGSIITFDKNGDINVTSNNDINLVPGSGNVNVTGDINVTGDVIADSDGDTISLHTHIHSGVTTGVGNTGIPVP